MEMTAPKKTNNIHGILLNPKTVLDIENLREDSASDEFGFSKKIDGFVNYVKEYLGNNNSIVVGIYGDYGSGKSVFINLIRDNLKSSDKNSKFIIFPAWKYKDEGSIWRNFILYASRELQNREKHDDLNNSLYYTKEKTKFDMKSIGLDLLILLIADIIFLHYITFSTGLTQSLFESITLIINLVVMIYTYHSTKRTKQPISYVEEFEETFKEMINNCTYEKIYVAIENIDRCLPDQSINLLESLKAFLDTTKNKDIATKKQLIFLIPCDKETVLNAIKNKCNINDSTYLDKLIQLPYDLPIPSNKNYKDYVESLLNNAYRNTELSLDEGRIKKRYFEFITDMLKLTEITNPREIKILLREWEMRFVNIDESIKYNKETWGKSINLESSLFLLKLLVLKKTIPNSYTAYLEIVSIIDDVVKDQTILSKVTQFMFKRGGWDDIFNILDKSASGTIYEGKIRNKEGVIKQASNLLVYGHIQPKSFEDLQKFMLVTNPKKYEESINYVYKPKR